MKKHAIFWLYAVFTLHSAAQTASQLPTCAQTCVVDPATGAGCSSLDTKCQCDVISTDTQLTACLRSSCSTSDVQQAEDYIQSLCTANGVTVSFASAAASTPSAAASLASAPLSSLQSALESITSAAVSSLQSAPTTLSLSPSTTHNAPQSSTSTPAAVTGSGPATSTAPSSPKSFPAGAAAGAGVGGTVVVVLAALGGFMFYRRRKRAAAAAAASSGHVDDVVKPELDGTGVYPAGELEGAKAEGGYASYAELSGKGVARGGEELAGGDARYGRSELDGTGRIVDAAAPAPEVETRR